MPTPLTSGHYAPRTAVKVHHWPHPDKNGDGEPVWRTEYDGGGNIIGRNLAVDAGGNEIRDYAPPEGFQNRPSYDNTDNYVKVNARGQIVRTPTGEAINAKPGVTVIEHADGSVRYLNDDYSRFLFLKSHEAVEAPPVEEERTGTVREDSTPDLSQVPSGQLAAFNAWKESQGVA